METGEFEKRLEWLDGERQKDKLVINELKDLMARLTDDLRKQTLKVKTIESELKKSTQFIARVDQFDEVFSQYKTEIQRQQAAIEKKIASSDKKNDKQRRDDIDAINKRLLEFQTDIKEVDDFKKSLQSRVEEDFRISQKVDEIAKSQAQLKNTDAELQRLQKSMTDENHLDSKRISDLQVETNTLRKKIEEERNANDANKEMIHKLDKRVNGIQDLEQTRKQEQVVFIENQNRTSVERENLWKEWQKKFDEIENMGLDFQNQLLALENTHCEVKKSQKEFDEINQRFERRINEITEMSRLSEERFRQEWVSFKADDQKRWTNYSLIQEEQQREFDREIARIKEQMVKMDDIVQDQKDLLNIVNEETQKRMSSLVSLEREMLESFEQSTSRRK